jgi:hypothetical protein
MPEQPISKLALYFTAPSYWLDGHSGNLRDFLNHLLDPSRAGFAVLGPANDDDEDADPTWLQGADAVAHVDSCYKDKWLPGEARISGRDYGDDDALLAEFVKTKAAIFMDHVRFEACRKLLSSEMRATSVPQNSAGPYWIGLTIDWAQPEETITWFPQFRVYSYWPESPQYAPPRAEYSTSDDGHSRRFAPAVAAEILDTVYWRIVETDFRNLRERFDLGMANTGEFEPPVFFVAEPASAPRVPEDYLEDDWWETLAALSKDDLRIRDPFASKVVIAVLDGRFTVFSNAVQSARWKQRQDYYLVLPAAASTTTHHALDEQRLSLLADQLAFVDFSASRTASIVINDATVIRQKLGVQATILARTSETAQRILDAASAAGSVKLEKADGDLRQLARELQLVVERMKLQFTRSELEIESLEARLARSKSIDAEDLTRRLSVRRAHRGRSLSGAEMAPTVVATTNLEELRRDGAREVRNLEQLKATFDGVLAHVAQGEHEREERAEKTLSYLLVFLAAIVAFPLLTGHMSWTELASVLNRRSTFGQILWKTHAIVAWISVVAAVAGILALACYLALRSGRLRSAAAARRMGRSPEFHKSRDEIASIWFKLAGEENPDGHNVATASVVRNPTDQRVLQSLAAESKWLLENVVEDGDGKPINGLRARVATVGALSELFMQRPNPLLLPTTLVFMRLCGPSFFGWWVGSEVVSDRELLLVLIACGMTTRQAREWIERIPVDERLLSARTIDDLAVAVEQVLFEDPQVDEAVPA